MTTLALLLHTDDALQFNFAAACLLAAWSVLCGWAGYAIGARASRRGESRAARRE